MNNGYLFHPICIVILTHLQKFDDLNFCKRHVENLLKKSEENKIADLKKIT